MRNGIRVADIIPLEHIRRSMHIYPSFGQVAPKEWTSANVLDLCAISLNATFYDGSHGKMPFGLSLVGGMGMDGRLMDIASYIERQLDV